MNRTLACRLAHAYARALFVLNILFFNLSILLYVCVLSDASWAASPFAKLITAGAFIAGLPIFAFLKNGMNWVREIKNCRAWMWRGVLGCGAFALLNFCLLVFVFPSGNPEGLMQPAHRMGIGGISVCVLYTALWSGTVDDAGLTKMARNSVLFLSFVAATFLAYHAGFLHHPDPLNRVAPPSN